MCVLRLFPNSIWLKYLRASSMQVKFLLFSCKLNLHSSPSACYKSSRARYWVEVRRIRLLTFHIQVSLCSVLDEILSGYDSSFKTMEQHDEITRLFFLLVATRWCNCYVDEVHNNEDQFRKVRVVERSTTVHSESWRSDPMLLNCFTSLELIADFSSLQTRTRFTLKSSIWPACCWRKKISKKITPWSNPSRDVKSKQWHRYKLFLVELAKLKINNIERKVDSG